MNRFLSLILLIILVNVHSLYAQFEVVNTYAGLFEFISYEKDGKKIFTDCKIDGKIISSELCNKIVKANQSVKSDKWIYEKTYTIQGILVQEWLHKGECISGPVVSYYPNGVKKSIEKYTNCSLKTGTSIFFSEKGDTLKIEKWDNGKFISVSPKQEKNEIWKVDVYLSGKKLTDSTNVVLRDKIKELNIIPYFKDKKSPSEKILVIFTLYVIGRREIKEQVDLSNLDKFKFVDILNKHNIPKNTFINVSILYNNLEGWNYSIKIE